MRCGSLHVNTLQSRSSALLRWVTEADQRFEARGRGFAAVDFRVRTAMGDLGARETSHPSGKKRAGGRVHA